MSIDSDVEVMRAKLAGAKGVPSLMAMAAKGNMSAAIALKEIKDQEDAKAAMQRQAGIQTDMPAGSVLSGLAAEIEAQKAPMPTTPMYADGGRVRNFAAGKEVNIPTDGYPAAPAPDEQAPLSEWERNLFNTLSALPGASSLKGLGVGMGMGARGIAPALTAMFAGTAPKTAEAGSLPSDEAQATVFNSSHSPEAREMAELLRNYKKPAAKAKDKTPGAGLADAVTDEMRADDRQPRPSLQGQAAAAPQTPEDIYLAKLEKLREEGKKLSAEQQKLLDDAHAKNKERLKGDGIWGILRHIGAQAGTKNGGRAMNAFAAGTREYNKEEKDRKGLVDKADELHAQNSLLLKKADLLAAEGDLKGAYELRNQAAKNAQEMELKKAQTRMYNANADAKPEEAAAKTVAAAKKGGAGGAGGAKPMTAYQKVQAMQKARAEGARMGMQGPELDEYAQEAYRQMVLAADTIPGNAQPGAQTGKVLDFNAI